MKHAVRNGTLIREEDAVLPVTRREVQSQFSIYETLKVKGGVPFFVEEHLQRFFESARILEMEHPFSPGDIAGSIDTLVREDGLESAALRLILVGGDDPFYIIFSYPLKKLSREYYTGGIDVITYPGERLIPRAKSTCLLLNYLAMQEAERRGAMEALFVDRNGKVTEGTRSNFFAVEDGTLVTAEEDVLYGVTRKHILEIASEQRVPIRYEKIGAGELTGGKYSELFISSTSIGAVPVAAVDGMPFPGRETGFPVVELLNAELEKREKQEAENYSA